MCVLTVLGVIVYTGCISLRAKSYVVLSIDANGPQAITRPSFSLSYLSLSLLSSSCRLGGCKVLVTDISSAMVSMVTEGC